MARNALVHAGFVVALLSGRDAHHDRAVTQASDMPPPWSTCEAVLSEAFHLLGERGAPNLGTLLRRRALLIAFTLTENVAPVVKLESPFLHLRMASCSMVRALHKHFHRFSSLRTICTCINKLY
jgi:hypothetical protein